MYPKLHFRKGLEELSCHYLMQEMLTVFKTKHHHDNQECLSAFFVMNLLFCWACWLLVQGSTKGKIKYLVYLFMYIFIFLWSWTEKRVMHARQTLYPWVTLLHLYLKLKILNPCCKFDGVINPLDKNYSITLQTMRHQLIYFISNILKIQLWV